MPDVKWQVLQVEVPEQLKEDLATEMKAAGIPVPDSEERWNMALDALKVHPLTLGESVVPACGLHRSEAAPVSEQLCRELLH